MTSIVLTTLGEKNSINYKSVLTTGGAESGTQNRATFSVKAKVAEKIKAGLLQIVKLCQAGK